MSVYRPKDCRTFRYRFFWRGKAYRGTTHQIRLDDAKLAEAKIKLRLRQELGGVAPLDPEASIRLQDWAEIYYVEAAKKVDSPERIQYLINDVLRFWGARPTDPKKIREGEPYHDLRLADPITDPFWIQRFEEWMDAKGWAGQTKNQHRSVMSQMYALAQSHVWRARTQVQMNPFAGLARDPIVGRDVTLTADQLRAVLAHASHHVRVAVAIGALAPKLRLANILQLEWSRHVDEAWQYITVPQHKTARRTGRPLVVPISAQLRAILKDTRRRHPSRYVIVYRGKPIASLRDGVAGACARAGLTYGRFTEGGITFHVLRHTAATILAERDVPEEKRRLAMGHTRSAMTQRYTHLRPVAELPAMEELSAALQIVDLVTLPWLRATTSPDQKSDQPARTTIAKPQQTRTTAKAGLRRPIAKRRNKIRA